MSEREGTEALGGDELPDARAREPGECGLHRLIVRALEQDHRARVCPKCGAEFFYRPPSALGTRTARLVPRAPRPELQITAMVRALLAWHVATVRAEGVTSSGRFVVRAGESSAVGAMRSLETGIVGTGCSGTRGAWGGAPEEPREVAPVLVDPDAERRYAALHGEPFLTAGAILADAQGDRVASTEVGARVYELTLEQRVALRLASAKTLRQWLSHVADRDSAPMLSGATELGARRLRECADAWWAA